MQQYLFTSPTLDARLQAIPGTILYEEINRVMASLGTLGIRFSISYITNRLRDGKPQKPPYLSCRYNVGDLEGVNIIAFYHLLISDWELMERRATWYRVRVRSVIRKEVIRAIQLKTVKARYDQSIEIQNNHPTAEAYYESLLDKIVQELIATPDGRTLVLTAAQLYYEDWSINSMEKLRATDQRLYGRDGYLISELIRQLVQIHCGEPLSEEVKSKVWDKKYVFRANAFSMTENLLNSGGTILRKAVPKLIDLSPTLVEALFTIERMIKQIHDVQPGRSTNVSAGAPFR
jgi:hypothetical protein